MRPLVIHRVPACFISNPTVRETTEEEERERLIPAFLGGTRGAEDCQRFLRPSLSYDHAGQFVDHLPGAGSRRIRRQPRLEPSQIRLRLGEMTSFRSRTGEVVKCRLVRRIEE